MTDLSGQTFGRYRILERLGEGGMATVYKAYDSMLDRDVAIKIIRREAFPPEILHDVLKRFEREAKSLARLSHPNIVNVLDFGEHGGSPFLVLQYLAGGTLKQLLGKPIPWREAARLLLPIARGIEYAHRRGVIHRDIKPANILLTEDSEPMLSDFGIAKIFGGEQTTHLTGTGMAIGTPEYMAPEQWTGETTAQSDVYALGIVLYEMITGRKPYVADTPGGILLKQAMEPLPLPSQFLPDLPAAVEALLLKALAKDPKDRYADMHALIVALQDLLSTSSTLPATPIQPGHPETLVAALQDGGATILPDDKPVTTSRPRTTNAVQETPISTVPAKPSVRLPRKNIFLGVGALVIVFLLIVGLPSLQNLFASAPIPTATTSATIATVPKLTPSPTKTALPPSATFEPSLTPTIEITSTATSLPVLAPTASSAEHKIIFYEYSDDTYNYYLLNLTTGVKELLSPLDANSPWELSYSPLGDMVAFETKDHNIQIANLDSSGLRTIADHPSGNSRPLWSPDGDKIAFASRRYRTSKDDLYVIDLASGSVAHLSCVSDTNPLYTHLYPIAWSNDGEKIALKVSYFPDYSSGKREHKPDEIYISDIDCKNVVLISGMAEAEYSSSFSWSPDDKRIAFSAYFEIFVSNADGTNRKQITNNVYNDNGVTWSPDGTKLLYSSDQISIIHPDGGSLLKLAEGYGPIWLSDGKSIAFVTDQGISLINIETKEKKNIYSSSNNPWLLWGK